MSAPSTPDRPADIEVSTDIRAANFVRERLTDHPTFR